jgi:hypothetical protein
MYRDYLEAERRATNQVEGASKESSGSNDELDRLRKELLGEPDDTASAENPPTEAVVAEEMLRAQRRAQTKAFLDKLKMHAGEP